MRGGCDQLQAGKTDGLRFRELLPGTWEARDDKLYVTNPDGTVEVLETSWAADRAARAAAVRAEEQARAAALQEHLQEKREKRPERRKGGRGT